MMQGLAADLSAVMPEVIASGLLVSLFTAQAPSGVYGATGAPDGTYANVAGLVNIPCTSPPISDSRLLAGEVKALAEIAASEFHHVLLDAYYPAIDAGWRDGWRCTIASPPDMVPYAFDIKGYEGDSQSKMSRVAVQLVTV
jgi:hypothetical protein